MKSTYFCLEIEESVSTSDASTAASLQNGEEKAEDWFQVGKKHRTHVLRTVNTNPVDLKQLMMYFRMKFKRVLLRTYLLASSVHQCNQLEIKNQ